MNSLAENGSIRSALLGRLLVVLILFLGWSLLILLRLVDLQALRGPQYRLRAQAQQQGFLEVNPKRGDILDRNLKELAISVRADSVFAQPSEIEDPPGAAEALSPIVGLPSESIRQKLESDSRFLYLKRQIPVETANRVRDLRLRGIGVQEESSRVYPGRELAGHLIGFVGVDNIGLEGIEYHYSRELSGERARVDLRLDARRNSFQRTSPAGQTQGNILVLTLDSSLQHIAETALKSTVRATSAADGSAIVMNPHTGEILAMASYPAYDPNDYAGADPSARRNRGILDMYEPGSVFKVITLAALLDTNLTTPDEVVDCRPGSARLAGKVYREATRSFGFLTVEEVIAKSSNVGTVKLAIRLGNERLYEYVSRLGFGERTGIDLPGEEGGLLRPTSQWSKLSIGALAIGQEIGVTPLQVIRAMAAIANGGYLVRPFVVRSVVSPEGDTLVETRTDRRPVLRPETSVVAQRILASVVEAGTGRNARLRGYSSAGKTGTAQKIVDGRYSRSKYVASYAGFAPLDNPALIALVVVNEPRGNPYGGHVAAPAFKEIMERSLIHLEIPHDRPLEVRPRGLEMVEAEPLDAAPEEFGILSEIEPLDPAPIGGLPASVLSVLEQEEQLVGRPEGGNVVVEFGKGVLPDFTGMSLRDSAHLAARLGIRLRISGAGVAVSQRPEPGRRIASDMVCEVFFASEDVKRDAPSRVGWRGPGGSRPQRTVRD